jgi:hypothetical protein
LDEEKSRRRFSEVQETFCIEKERKERRHWTGSDKEQVNKIANNDNDNLGSSTCGRKANSEVANGDDDEAESQFRSS